VLQLPVDQGFLKKLVVIIYKVWNLKFNTCLLYGKLAPYSTLVPISKNFSRVADPVSVHVGPDPNTASENGTVPTLYPQCCGSGSVDWIRIQWGPWVPVRIRIRIKEEKNGQEKYKTVNKFQLLKCWMFSVEGRRLLLYRSLDVLYGGLGIGKLQFSIKIIFKYFSGCEFI
jgi:hypothetical protein